MLPCVLIIFVILFWVFYHSWQTGNVQNFVLCMVQQYYIAMIPSIHFSKHALSLLQPAEHSVNGAANLCHSLMNLETYVVLLCGREACVTFVTVQAVIL